MKYLIDTHILLWAIFHPIKLKNKHRELLENNKEIFVSSITLWEISLKFALGKLELNGLKPEDMIKVCHEMDITIIDIDQKSFSSYNKLPQVKKHKDPFDRIIIWFCINNSYTLLSQDESFKAYYKYGLDFF